jgi:hypothetical protein
LLYAHHFYKQDWSQSTPKQHIFREVADYEISGKIFRPNKYTGLIFDVKKFNLKTGELGDVGFGYQYLVHNVNGTMHIIGGQYQVPIYKGPIPTELLDSFFELDSKLIRRPDKLLRRLYECGEIQQQGNMQLISVVSKITATPIDQKVEQPSLLFVIDKTDLKKYTI